MTKNKGTTAGSEPLLSHDHLAINIREETTRSKKEEEISVDTEKKDDYQREIKEAGLLDGELKVPLTDKTVMAILQRERQARHEHAEQLKQLRNEYTRVRQQQKIERLAPLRALQQEQKDIDESISLLEKGIRKRQLPIQVLMSAIMLGTAVYLLRNWLYVDPHTRQQMSTEMYNQLENQLAELSAEYPSLQQASQEAFYKLSHTYFNITTTYDSGTWTDTIRCSRRGVGDAWWSLPDNCVNTWMRSWPCAIQSQSQYNAPCGDDYPNDWNGGLVQSPDRCPPLINRWCSTFANYSFNIQSNQTASYNFAHFNDYANQIINDHLYGWMSDILTYYAIFISFGEALPLIILAITFFTYALTNCLSFSRLCSLNNEDSATIVTTAQQHSIDVPNSQGDYKGYLHYFKNRSVRTARAIETIEAKEKNIVAEEKKLVDCRYAILMGKVQREGKPTPAINKLFGMPTLIDNILEYAGIGLPTITKKP